MKSALYVGWVRHRRHAPRAHSFRYPLFMAYLDLSELGEVFKGRWLWSTRRAAVARFAREDHLGDPRVPLDEAVRELVEAKSGRRPRGPIRLLTHLRYAWRLAAPGTHLGVHMRLTRKDETVFDATLALRREPIANGVLLRFPLMTAKVIAAIHWEALRLWLKRVPFHTHPAKAQA